MVATLDSLSSACRRVSSSGNIRDGVDCRLWNPASFGVVRTSRQVCERVGVENENAPRQLMERVSASDVMHLVLNDLMHVSGLPLLLAHIFNVGERSVGVMGSLRCCCPAHEKVLNSGPAKVAVTSDIRTGQWRSQDDADVGTSLFQVAPALRVKTNHCGKVSLRHFWSIIEIKRSRRPQAPTHLSPSHDFDAQSCLPPCRTTY